MSKITISTPFNIDLEFVTAPLNRRVGAVLLDMFVLLLYMMLAYRFIFVGAEVGSNMNQFVMMFSISILPFLYFPITEILMNGQTPGKRLLGIKVIDISGNEPGVSQYLLRWLVGFGNYSVFLLPYLMVSSSMAFFLTLMSFLFTIGIFYFPDFLCSAISSKNQRLADLAAATVVIDIKKKMSFGETIYLEIQDEQYVVKYPQVMLLSDRDINGIRNLLNKKSNKKDDWEYRATIAQRICTALNIVSQEIDDTIFLERLLKDYNFLTQRK